MKWEPIETAPRDGTVIDLWDSEFGRITEQWWDEDDGCWSGFGPENITHWMPLPGAPT